MSEETTTRGRGRPKKYPKGTSRLTASVDKRVYNAIKKMSETSTETHSELTNRVLRAGIPIIIAEDAK